MLFQKIDLGVDTLSNCYLFVDEETGKAAIVDPGYYTDSLKELVESKKYQFEYVLLTHGHFDHILGAADFRNATGAKIVINENDAEKLTSREKNLMIRFNVQAPFSPCNADLLVDDGDIIKIGNSELKVMHTPGHSGGGVCYIDEEARNIATGDTLFLMTVGRTDTYDGDETILASSIRKLIALEGDYDVYPGHGPATSLSRERVRNHFIRRMESL